MGTRMVWGCGAHYTQSAPKVTRFRSRPCRASIYTHTICVGDVAMNKMVRKQVFISAEQNKRLKAHAAAAGVSEAELVRAASICAWSRRRRSTTGAASPTACRVRGPSATTSMRRCGRSAGAGSGDSRSWLTRGKALQMILVDTNILIDFLRGSLTSDRLVRSRSDERPAISAISVLELYAGVRSQRDERDIIELCVRSYAVARDRGDRRARRRISAAFPQGHGIDIPDAHHRRHGRASRAQARDAQRQALPDVSARLKRAY